MSSYKLSWNNHEVIKVLTRNAIKCLVCNTVLESKYRHNYVQCRCPNEVATDGGLGYQGISAKDLDLIENLCEYVEMTGDDLNKLKEFYANHPSEYSWADLKTVIEVLEEHESNK